MAIQRAEDKTAQLQARAGAIDELLASGALDDPSGMAKDDIQAELDRLSGGTDVELELQRMKAELAGGTSQAIGTGGGTTGGQQAIEGGTGQSQPQSDAHSDAQSPQQDTPDTPRFDKR